MHRFTQIRLMKVRRLDVVPVSLSLTPSPSLSAATGVGRGVGVGGTGVGDGVPAQAARTKMTSTPSGRKDFKLNLSNIYLPPRMNNSIFLMTDIAPNSDALRQVIRQGPDDLPVLRQQHPHKHRVETFVTHRGGRLLNPQTRYKPYSRKASTRAESRLRIWTGVSKLSLRRDTCWG